MSGLDESGAWNNAWPGLIIAALHATEHNGKQSRSSSMGTIYTNGGVAMYGRRCSYKKANDEKAFCMEVSKRLRGKEIKTNKQTNCRIEF